MFLLLVNISNNIMQLDIYKRYRNKKIVHEVLIKVIKINEKNIQLMIYNSNNMKLVDKMIDFKANTLFEDKLKLIFQHEKLLKYEFSCIINKIKDGGTRYADIILLHNKMVANLAKINDSVEQEQQLKTAEYLHSHYEKAKHYVCFDSGFYNTTDKSLQTAIGLEPNIDFGMYLSGISNKLIQYSIKAKRIWLIAVIEPEYIIFTLIKKQKCLMSNKIKLNLFTDGAKAIDRLNCLKVSAILAQILTVVGEVYGIVISGSLGYSHNKIRRMILKPLSWSGIMLNTKSTNYLSSKKSSIMPIICINSNESKAMLNQLLERL